MKTNRKFTAGFALADLLLLIAIVGLVAACALPPAAHAQGGFNSYAEFRTIVLAAPTKTLGSEGATIKSNAVVDTHGFVGIAKIDFIACTNAGGGTVTATLLQSDDQTTWSTGPSYSLATQATAIYTNLYYGTNGLTATNTYNLPGAVTTATAATAGFAGQYLDANANPFTNTGAINVVGTATPVTTIGYNIGDAKRYVRVQWTYGGTTTNVMHAAVLTARKQNYP